MSADYQEAEKTIRQKEGLPDCVREFLLWYIRTEPLTTRCNERRRHYTKEARFLLETMKPHNLELAVETRRELNLRTTILAPEFR